MRIDSPNWDILYEVAENQGGYFTTAQAAECGFSSPLLNKHLGRRIERARRGIYRLRHFPAHEQADLIIWWLWSEKEGIFSHATALVLHGLSDVLPNYATLKVPQRWGSRRVITPEGLELRYGDTESHDWIGVVPTTTVCETLVDCFESPGLLPHAIAGWRDAKAKNLLSDDENVIVAKVRNSKVHGG